MVDLDDKWLSALQKSMLVWIKMKAILDTGNAHCWVIFTDFPSQTLRPVPLATLMMITDLIKA